MRSITFEMGAEYDKKGGWGEEVEGEVEHTKSMGETYITHRNMQIIYMGY